jgi:V-type H+-transporting ATPase subunit B
MVAVDKPGLSAQEAAAINAAAVTRNYAVKPRLRYQTVSAVSGSQAVVQRQRLMY